MNQIEKENKALWQQACKRTLKIVSGVNTMSVMSKVGSSPLPNLQPSDLFRLALRNYQDDYDRLLVAICIASRDRGLKKVRSGCFKFRGREVRLPRSYTVAKEDASRFLSGLTDLFSDEEIKEMDTPVNQKD